ncbi:DUF3040 domain-containing protein [Canibacter zhoujuaniae]|uniref:DUF3040 domain-containing protein n=1 Tax=Canibacter zhoujuaniae TaxID=2708343 RepID=UPI001423F684|nr:DUF3040 domain-containing protein [Canibacter zhoujuaniae]
MSLSNREQEIFQRIEQEFYASEADEVPTDRAPQPLNYRNLVFGLLIIIAGVGVLLAAVALKQPLLGLLGFVAMLAGGFFAFRPANVKNEKNTARTAAEKSANSQAARQSPMEKIEDRWRRRMEGEL